MAAGLGVGVGDGRGGREPAHVAPPRICLLEDVEDAGTQRQPPGDPHEDGGVEDGEAVVAEAFAGGADALGPRRFLARALRPYHLSAQPTRGLATAPAHNDLERIHQLPPSAPAAEPSTLALHI